MAQKLFMVNSIKQQLMVQLFLLQSAWYFVGLVYRIIASTSSNLILYNICTSRDICNTISATDFMRSSVHGEIALLLSYVKTVRIYKENSSIFHAINFRRFHHEHFLSYDKWQYLSYDNRHEHAKKCYFVADFSI